MANLIAFQTGNFNAANFKSVDTATGAAQTTKVFTGFTATTTSLAFSPTFSGTNAASNDGILMFVGRTSASATGTFTVGLSSNGVSTNLASVTVNASDIPLLNNTSNAGTQNFGQGGWVFFKWASPVVLATGVNYQVAVVSSVAGTIQVYRSVTANDWCRLMRLGTSLTPAAADVVYIAGEWTAAATVAAITITIDTTTAISTTYGQIDVGASGTLQFGTSAFTMYRLKMNANMNIWGGGTLNIGTSGTPIPNTSSALLEFQSASASQFGLYLSNGTMNTHGASIGATGGRISASVSNKALTTNVATLTTSVVHGFAASDTVVITGVDSVFDGSYTIASTPTTTSFTYAKVNANVSSVAVSPLGCATTTTTVSNKALTSNVATLTTAQTHGFTVNSQTVTNKQLTDNLATLTTSVAHGFQQVNFVYVSIGDAAFDGLHQIVWCPTSTTFQFLKTASDVLSQSASGTATVGPQVLVENVDATFNGTYNILTVPSTTTFTYVKVAANVGSTGASGTASLIREKYTRITTNAAAASSSLSLVNGTGWAGADSLSIATTNRGNSENETRIIGSTAGLATVLTAVLTNTHSGTNTATASTPNQDTRAEVACITRNVRIGGLTSTNTAYVFADSTSVVNCQWTEFFFCGSNSTDRYGFSLGTSAAGLSAGSAVFNYCTFHDTVAGYGCHMYGTATDSLTVTHCVFSQVFGAGVYVPASTAGTGISVDNCIGIRVGYGVASNALVRFDDTAPSLSNCIMVSGASLIITETGSTVGWSNLLLHSFDSIALSIVGTTSHDITLSYITIWRTNSIGLDTAVICWDVVITNLHIFGSNATNVNSGNRNHNFTFRNIYLDAGATLAATTGWAWAASHWFLNWKINNLLMGTVQTHSTADISLAGAGSFLVDMDSVTLASATPINNSTLQANFTQASRIGANRWNHTAGSHRTLYVYGTVLTDTVRYRTASPSEQLLPTAVPTTSRVLRLESSPKRCAINSGNTTTVSVWVRTSVLGDGGANNGNRAQLILKANHGAGILSNMVLATATAASDGAFELLSGTTPAVAEDCVLEFVVSSSGTAGFINVDDWSVT